MNAEPEPPRDPGRTAGGIALIVIGLLILIPSGLCTGILGAGALIGGFLAPGSGAEPPIVMVLLVGGPFVAVGWFLVWGGWKLLRRNRGMPPPD